MRTLMIQFLQELGAGKAVPETVSSHPRPGQAIDAGEDQRQSKRHETTGDSVLFWKDRVKGRVGSSAVARNVSKHGLQVEVSVPVPVPTVVRLSGQTLECVGSTRYCRLFRVLSGRRSQIEFPTVEVDGVDEVLLIAETARRGLDPLNP